MLLATGGLGQVYSDTTNPAVATGDGVAMAHRAGAEISDMEFVQFHPTALFLKNAPRFLLSEALRGEGAYLRNFELTRFMPQYHEPAELAPRDVVARAIAHELERVKRPDAAVYLDLTHLNAERVRKRFPTIYATCMQYNIDIATELVPVRPGGALRHGRRAHRPGRADLHSRTLMPPAKSRAPAYTAPIGWPAIPCWKAWCTERAQRRSCANSCSHVVMRRRRVLKAATASSNGQPAETEKFIAKVQSLMWQYVGVVRDGKGSAAGRLRS